MIFLGRFFSVDRSSKDRKVIFLVGNESAGAVGNLSDFLTEHFYL